MEMILNENDLVVGARFKMEQFKIMLMRKKLMD